MANGCLIFCGITIASLVIIPSLAFGIASYVIGFQNWEYPVCTHDALIPLPIWLIAFGSVEFFSLILTSIFLLISLCSGGEGGSAASIILLVLYSIPYMMWCIAWSIVGGVSLFRDSMSCLNSDNPHIQNTDLWAMTLAALIWQWLGIFRVCCNSGASKTK